MRSAALVALLAFGCSSGPPGADASSPADARPAGDASARDAAIAEDATATGDDASGAADASGPDAAASDASPSALDAAADDAAVTADASAPDDAAAAPDASVDPCASSPCYPGVVCTSSAATYACGACPSGLTGDGVQCVEDDECLGAPCLPSTTCTDVPAPGTGFSCSVCVGASCPILRALAGPDHVIVAGSTVTLPGAAVGFNGAYSCAWTNDRDARVVSDCALTVTPTAATSYTLTVTDASARTASDVAIVSLAPFTAEAGPSQNITSGGSATITGTWAGASCADASCVRCEWTDSNNVTISNSCTFTASPLVTSQYFLIVTDDGAGGRTATDSTTLFVTDVPANLCGWNVVVMTSDEYPSSPNPNYLCDPSGNARRQTANGKPSIVLSDLSVSNARIVGYMSVETTGDDDLIGFLWGWQDPGHAYLLTWKQAAQSWTARCGNALSGIAVKKIDAPANAPRGISFNAAFGHRATDLVYGCAVGWSTDRNDTNLLGTQAEFLVSPSDVGAYTGGWRDNITYRFEFFHTPTRTRILVYEDEAMSGSTAAHVTTLDVVDSSYPGGQFAFFSNSQEQVQFGDFTLASLDDFRALAGPDRSARLGEDVTLDGSAELAVPPYLCEWSDAAQALVGSSCALTVTASVSTIYTLTITDGFGRVATDTASITVAP